MSFALGFFSIIFSAILLAVPLLNAEMIVPMGKNRQVSSEYVAKDYTYLFGMQGFNDALLKMHFQLYQGYVKNTNLLLSRMKELEGQDKELSYEYGALKRRFAWEFDGMRLHEYYFENLGGDEPLDKSE